MKLLDNIKNKTLIEMVRTILCDNNLLKYFLLKLLIPYATYLIGCLLGQVLRKPPMSFGRTKTLTFLTSTLLAQNVIY